jgi:hypothetical protein
VTVSEAISAATRSKRVSTAELTRIANDAGAESHRRLQDALNRLNVARWGAVLIADEEISAKVHELTNLVTGQAQRRGEDSGMGNPEFREEVIRRQTELGRRIQDRLVDE